MLRMKTALPARHSRTFTFLAVTRSVTGWGDQSVTWLAPETESVTLTLTIEANKTRSNTVVVATPLKEGRASETRFVAAEIIPDYDRNGKIDDHDRGRVTPQKPWRFWINDDNDEHDTEGDDIPQGAEAAETNGKNTKVDGRRDLIDFFPLWPDLRELLHVLPPETHTYRLTQEAPQGDPLTRVVFAPDLNPATSSAYLDNFENATSVAWADSRSVSPTGPYLPDDILEAIKLGKGLLLVEGVKPTDSPLVLKIQTRPGNVTVATIPLPVSISGVEDMFRHYNLRMDAPQVEPDNEFDHPPAANRPGVPANLPDSSCNADWLVFVHGYNVNGRKARGWQSEAFKRLFWSGSHARFVGMSWFGNETQIMGRVTPKYYENVDNALHTAPLLADLVNRLPGGRKFLVSHSLGGLVAGSAIAHHQADVERAFLLNPALPTEAFLPAGALANDACMEPKFMRPYPDDIKSSPNHTSNENQHSSSSDRHTCRLVCAILWQP